MGYPIVCRYNFVFVSLSKRLNITFFPLALAPPMHTSMYKTIFVGFVNNNHSACECLFRLDMFYMMSKLGNNIYVHWTVSSESSC